jgi:hypothetical protein
MENNMEVSQKTKNITAILLTNTNPSDISEGM